MLNDHIETVMDLFNESRHLFIAGIVLIYLVLICRIVSHYEIYAVMKRRQTSSKAVKYEDEDSDLANLLISKSMVSLWLNVITLVLITFFTVMMYVSA